MAPSAETKNDGGSEYWNRETMTAPSVETENDGGFERQNWDVALNAEIVKRWWLRAPKLRMMVALNTETEIWPWTPKLWNDDGSERRTKDVALNAKIKMNNDSER